VFALLVMPAATSQVITARPALSLGLTVALGLGVAWLGVGISYFSPYPASFFIATVAFAIYVLVRIPAALSGRRSRGPSGHPSEPAPTGVIA
jgi:zinc/manganese transport system permease protein